MENGASVSSLISGVQSELMGAIGEVLPTAGVVLGAVAGIFFGVKVFKRITGART